VNTSIPWRAKYIRKACIPYFGCMSRGFVKEDDQEEAAFIPPRAPLPDGVPNYVTPRGLQRLHDERIALERERADVQGGDDDRRRAQAGIDGRLALLNERIATARLVEPRNMEHHEVRFGNTVTFVHVDGPQQGTRRRFTIVGVDEASVKDHRIAFTAPIARALIGKGVGERVAFRPAATVQFLDILDIQWIEDP